MTAKRMFARACAAAAMVLGVAVWTGAAQAQSTMQQIKQKGELRIGVTPGEPWFFKDPGSGAWSGIGYAMGQQVAKDLGVKLVPVETTWGNSIAAIQANQIDVMFVLDATDERKKAIDFPDAPFFWYAQGVLMKDGMKVKSWSDIDRIDIDATRATIVTRAGRTRGFDFRDLQNAEQVRGALETARGHAITARAAAE